MPVRCGIETLIKQFVKKVSTSSICLNMKYLNSLLLILMINTYCFSQLKQQFPDSMVVTASAYNSVAEQTTVLNPSIAAWGDTLKPGMKVIAVSRDLIPIGLDHLAPVKIKGLDGTFLVIDKMHHRWKKKIDIYMGTDTQTARNWGRRQVMIYFKRKGSN